jgi:predicted RNA-binding protein YlxR (DUF448 family)
MTRRGVTITSKKKSHSPIRTCIVCRKKKSKQELIRLAVDQDNQVIVDMKGTIQGRGAYICRNKSCAEKLTVYKKIDRVFKKDVRIISERLRFTI